MKLAVAQRRGSRFSVELRHAELLVIYAPEGRRFVELERREMQPHTAPLDTLGWLQALRGCSGLLARAIPPRLAFDLHQHGIVTLSDGGFGAANLDEALRFLQAIARDHTFSDGGGI